MIHAAEQLVTAGSAISAKVWAGVGVVGLALADVSNPFIAIGAIATAILAVAALVTKSWRWLNSSIRAQQRQDRMLEQFEGSPGQPGVMDQIKALHEGQAAILRELRKLTP